MTHYSTLSLGRPIPYITETTPLKAENARPFKSLGISYTRHLDPIKPQNEDLFYNVTTYFTE